MYKSDSCAKNTNIRTYICTIIRQHSKRHAYIHTYVLTHMYSVWMQVCIIYARSIYVCTIHMKLCVHRFGAFCNWSLAARVHVQVRSTCTYECTFCLRVYHIKLRHMYAQAWMWMTWQCKRAYCNVVVVQACYSIQKGKLHLLVGQGVLE